MFHHMHMMHLGFGLMGLGLLIGLFLLFVHFLPAYIAFSRNHPARWAILLVNLFFGWTLVGWAITLIWALAAPQTVVVYPPPPYPPPGGPGRF